MSPEDDLLYNDRCIAIEMANKNKDHIYNNPDYEKAVKTLNDNLSNEERRCVKNMRWLGNSIVKAMIEFKEG